MALWRRVKNIQQVRSLPCRVPEVLPFCFWKKAGFETFAGRAQTTPSSFMRLLLLASLLTAFFSCGNGDTKPAALPANDLLPAAADTANISISDLNCWSEQGQFFVVGICDNRAGAWQRIWLRMEPTDSTGRPITCNGQPSVVIPTFSPAVPPLGRTSFFAGWPLSAFSGQPRSCRITGAGAVAVPAGPILIGGEQSGVRMMTPDPSDATRTIEKGWQASVVIQNPLQLPAQHPCVELLIYGKDQRLWFSQLLDPSDPALRGTVTSTGEGPLQPQEQRRISANIFYPNLPKQLQDVLIGRVEFLPFDKR